MAVAHGAWQRAIAIQRQATPRAILKLLLLLGLLLVGFICAHATLVAVLAAMRATVLAAVSAAELVASSDAAANEYAALDTHAQSANAEVVLGRTLSMRRQPRVAVECTAGWLVARWRLTGCLAAGGRVQATIVALHVASVLVSSRWRREVLVRGAAEQPLCERDVPRVDARGKVTWP